MQKQNINNRSPHHQKSPSSISTLSLNNNNTNNNNNQQQQQQQHQQQKALFTSATNNDGRGGTNGFINTSTTTTTTTGAGNLSSPSSPSSSPQQQTQQQQQAQILNNIKPMDVFDLGNPNERKSREQLAEMVNGILVSSGSKALREPSYCTRPEFQQQLSKLPQDQKWIAYLRPHYVILSRLGRGGYGSVFRARQTKQGDLAVLTANVVPLDSPRAAAKKNSYVAVKVIDRQAILSSQSRVKHLAVELAVLQLPAHPNVNHRLGVYHTKDHIIVILELCEAPRPTVFTRLAHCVAYRKPSKIGEIDRIYDEWKKTFKSNVDWMSRLEYASEDVDANEENEEIFGNFVDEEKLFLKLACELDFPVFGNDANKSSKNKKNKKNTNNNKPSAAAQTNNNNNTGESPKPVIPIEIPSSSSLFNIIQAYKRVSDSMSRVIMKQILLGLKNLHHRHKVVHRDIKTENIVVAITRTIKNIERDKSTGKITGLQFDEKVSVKIVDFGLAKYFLNNNNSVSGTQSPSASSSISHVFTDQDSNLHNNSIATSTSVSTMMMSPSYSSLSHNGGTTLSHQVSASSFLTSSPQQHLPNAANMINIIPATPQNQNINNNSTSNNNNQQQHQQKMMSVQVGVVAPAPPPTVPAHTQTSATSTTSTAPNTAPNTNFNQQLLSSSNTNIFGNVNAAFTASSNNNIATMVTAGPLTKDSSSMSEPPPMKIAVTQDYCAGGGSGGSGGATNTTTSSSASKTQQPSITTSTSNSAMMMVSPNNNQQQQQQSASQFPNVVQSDTESDEKKKNLSSSAAEEAVGSGHFNPVGREETEAFGAGGGQKSCHNNNNNHEDTSSFLNAVHKSNFQSNASYESHASDLTNGDSSSFQENQQSSHDVFKKVDIDNIEIPVSSFGRNPLSNNGSITNNANASFGMQQQQTTNTTMGGMINTTSSAATGGMMMNLTTTPNTCGMDDDENNATSTSPSNQQQQQNINNNNNNSNQSGLFYLGPTGFNDASSSPSFPVVSTPIGTDLYLALEALRGIINFAQLRSRWITTNKQLYKLDVYGVGAMLFFMSNGKPPFQPPQTYRKVSKEARMQQLEELVSKGPQFLQCVSSYTKHFALKMMENDVDKRLSVRRALEDKYVKEVGDALLTDIGVSGVKKILIYDSKEQEEQQAEAQKEKERKLSMMEEEAANKDNEDDDNNDDEDEDEEGMELQDSSQEEDELNELRRRREDFGDYDGKGKK